MSVRSPRGLSEEGMGGVRMPARSRRWQVWATKVSSCSERLESGFRVDLEKMGSYSSLEGSGWRGAKEGMGSKCGEARDWTASELDGAEQPLPSSRWMPDQRASNVGS